MQIVKLKIEDLKPYDKNAKLHTKEQIEQIKNSIKDFGMNDPIGVWSEDNIIVEGHGRLEALKELGYTEVECIRLDHLTDEERKAYTLAHNKLTMNTGFDKLLLGEELKGIADIDMSKYGFEIEEPEKEVQEEPMPELTPEPWVKPGDLFQLGDHRLICGDSLDEKVIAKLLNKAVIDLLVTDPPYNVSLYDNPTPEEIKARKLRKDGKHIENDKMTDSEFLEFLNKAFANAEKYMKPGAAFYIWYASREAVNFELALNACGLEVRQQLVWNKNIFTLSRQDYQWKHEPCLYGWKEGAGHYFINDRTQDTILELGEDIDKLKKEELRDILKRLMAEASTTVIDEAKPSRSIEHPTMKPIRLIAKQIRNSTRPGENILDIFSGSGTTLIAAEQLGRKCYAVELDPQYAQATIERWENLTGRQAVKVAK